MWRSAQKPPNLCPLNFVRKVQKPKILLTVQQFGEDWKNDAICCDNENNGETQEDNNLNDDDQCVCLEHEM